MSKTDLRARPIYHHKRDSIEAHLTIVMAALAVSNWLERQTGWSIKKLVTTLRHHAASPSRAATTSSTPQHPSTPTPEPPSMPSRTQPLDTKLSQVRICRNTEVISAEKVLSLNMRKDSSTRSMRGTLEKTLLWSTSTPRPFVACTSTTAL